MLIRKYEPADCEKIIKLFRDTVHAVNAKDYTEEQLNAWTEHVEIDKWNRSLLEHFSIVAVEDGAIVGFGDIDLNYSEKAGCELNTDGCADNKEIDGCVSGIEPKARATIFYLERLYVHKDHQRRGIAAALCVFLERQALKRNADGEIVTHASITAKPFFEKRGYNTVKEQYVERAGILLKNYVMIRAF